MICLVGSTNNSDQAEYDIKRIKRTLHIESYKNQTYQRDWEKLRVMHKQTEKQAKLVIRK